MVDSGRQFKGIFPAARTLLSVPYGRMIRRLCEA